MHSLFGKFSVSFLGMSGAADTVMKGKGDWMETDQLELERVNTVIQAGLDNAESGDLARNLVYVLDDRYHVCSNIIYALQSDGRLRIVDGFGFSKEVTRSFGHLDLFDDLPVTRAIRESQSTTLPIDRVMGDWPELANYDLPHSGFIVMPCHSLGVSTGGLILGIAAPHPVHALPPAIEAAVGLVGSWSIVLHNRRSHER